MFESKDWLFVLSTPVLGIHDIGQLKVCDKVVPEV